MKLKGIKTSKFLVDGKEVYVQHTGEPKNIGELKIFLTRILKDSISTPRIQFRQPVDNPPEGSRVLYYKTFSGQEDNPDSVLKNEISLTGASFERFKEVFRRYSDKYSDEALHYLYNLNAIKRNEDIDLFFIENAWDEFPRNQQMDLKCNRSYGCKLLSETYIMEKE